MVIFQIRETVIAIYFSSMVISGHWWSCFGWLGFQSANLCGLEKLSTDANPTNILKDYFVMKKCTYFCVFRRSNHSLL